MVKTSITFQKECTTIYTFLLNSTNPRLCRFIARSCWKRFIDTCDGDPTFWFKTFFILDAHLVHIGCPNLVSYWMPIFGHLNRSPTLPRSSDFLQCNSSSPEYLLYQDLRGESVCLPWHEQNQGDVEHCPVGRQGTSLKIWSLDIKSLKVRSSKIKSLEIKSLEMGF